MQDTEMQDTDWASRDWTYGKILRDKTIVVTGCSSGIGRDTAKLIKQLGGDVIGVDRNKTEDYVDELYLADLSDRRTIKALVHALPGRIDGIANIAGLPPTAPADLVVKVNLVGLKYFTELMVPKLNDNASIVNQPRLPALAGRMRWRRSRLLNIWHSRMSSASCMITRSAMKAGAAISSARRRWLSGPRKTAGPGATAASG